MIRDLQGSLRIVQYQILIQILINVAIHLMNPFTYPAVCLLQGANRKCANSIGTKLQFVTYINALTHTHSHARVCTLFWKCLGIRL